jgi:hypothetical protein
VLSSPEKPVLANAKENAMLSQTLQAMIDQKWTNAREIGELTGVAPSTVYRWISGESEPDFQSIRLLMRHLKDDRAQRSLVTAFLAGTNWHANGANGAGGNLDFNRDGKVTGADALQAAIQVVRGAGDALDEVHEAVQDGRITEQEAVGTVSKLDQVVRDCNLVRAILVTLVEHRKQAK